MPIKRIGELCRKKGILFGVDAAQTAGVVPINMKEMNIDYLCVAPHKGLYAPMGIGILICEKGISGTIIEGGTGTNSIEMRQPEEYPEKLESGTLNVPGIMGIGAGIDYVNRLGINKIYREEMLLIERLYTQLEKNPDVKLYTPRPKINSYAPVLSFNLSGKQSIDTAQMLSDNGIAVRGGLHCSPLAHSAVGTINGGTVRVSVATFNTTFDIDRLASVINNKKMKKV